MNNVTLHAHVCFPYELPHASNPSSALLAVISLTEYFQRVSSGNLDFMLDLEGLVLKLMEFDVFLQLYQQEIRYRVTSSVLHVCVLSAG